MERKYMQTHMSEVIRKNVEEIIRAVSALHKVGLLVVERDNAFASVAEEMKSILAHAGFRQCSDDMELMDALSSGSKKLFYIEDGERLDGHVLEIVAEFDLGMVSLFDRKHKTGLKVAHWRPTDVSFIVIMTRSQVEESCEKLFEYVNLIRAI